MMIGSNAFSYVFLHGMKEALPPQSELSGYFSDVLKIELLSKSFLTSVDSTCTGISSQKANTHRLANVELQGLKDFELFLQNLF